MQCFAQFMISRFFLLSLCAICICLAVYKPGILLIFQGGKGKKLHYIILQLKNKRLQLIIVKGEPKLDIEDTRDLNDGLWHHVVLSRAGNRIVMIVDSNKPKRRKRYPKKLNIGNTMYVGGVPESGVLLPELLVSFISVKQ